VLGWGRERAAALVGRGGCWASPVISVPVKVEAEGVGFCKAFEEKECEERRWSSAGVPKKRRRKSRRYFGLRCVMERR
jgi:hypothetical protein